MKGPMIIFLVAVFLLLIVAYLAQETEPGKRFGSKAYHMLLLGLMRLDLACTRGVHYIQLMLETVFKGYHMSVGHTEKLHRKEQQVKEYRRSNGNGDYARKKQYNRKILE